MKVNPPPALRLPILWFATALLLGGGVFHLALEARSASEARRLTTQQAAERAEHDLRQTPERLARDRAQSDIYARLGTAGFLGEEDRLNWLSSLSRLRTSLDLQQLSWRLTPRTASSLSPGLYRSGMVLDLAPIDADRLNLFMTQLRGIAHGRFTLHECSLRPDPNGRQGTATCALDWWTWHGE